MKFSQFPKGINSYLMLKNTDDPKARKMIECLDTAMNETFVRPEPESRQIVGDVVYRLMMSSIQGGKLKVNTDDMPGMSAVCDTYDRFRTLINEVDWTKIGD